MSYFSPGNSSQGSHFSELGAFFSILPIAFADWQTVRFHKSSDRTGINPDTFGEGVTHDYTPSISLNSTSALITGDFDVCVYKDSNCRITDGSGWTNTGWTQGAWAALRWCHQAEVPEANLLGSYLDHMLRVPNSGSGRWPIVISTQVAMCPIRLVRTDTHILCHFHPFCMAGSHLPSLSTSPP